MFMNMGILDQRELGDAEIGTPVRNERQRSFRLVALCRTHGNRPGGISLQFPRRNLLPLGSERDGCSLN